MMDTVNINNYIENRLFFGGIINDKVGDKEWNTVKLQSSTSNPNIIKQFPI